LSQSAWPKNKMKKERLSKKKPVRKKSKKNYNNKKEISNF